MDRYLDRFFKKLGVRFHGSVLDLGCGDGRIATEIAPTAEAVLGIDAVPHERWRDRHPANVSFREGDAEHLTLPDASFDVVLSVNMLHHTSHPATAIGEMQRVCKPGGTIVIVEPNRFNPLGYVHLTLMGNHQHFPTPRFTRMIAETLGAFELRQFECHCYPVPGGMLDVIERVEDRLERWSLWKPFVFYNAAIAQARGDRRSAAHEEIRPEAVLRRNGATVAPRGAGEEDGLAGDKV